MGYNAFSFIYCLLLLQISTPSRNQQQTGTFVLRPSSKGADAAAVGWKVAGGELKTLVMYVTPRGYTFLADAAERNGRNTPDDSFFTSIPRMLEDYGIMKQRTQR